MNLTIIHKPTQEEPFVILDKPRGLPSAPLKDGDDSALTRAIEIFPQIKDVNGKKPVEYGLVHRIDTQTRGLILIAMTQKFYDHIQLQQKEDKFIKEYTATIEYIPECAQILTGFPPFSHDLNIIISNFRAFGPKGSQVRPVTSCSGKASLKKSGTKSYTTKIEISGNIAKCTITQGYRHQVRCHLAWSSHPVKGDRLYNPNYKENQEMEFEATKLTFVWNDKICEYEI